MSITIEKRENGWRWDVADLLRLRLRTCPMADAGVV